MISVAVDNRKAWLTESETLTSGSLGQTVNFEFSDDWDGLSRFAVFVAYDRREAVTLLENSIGIPKSVLTLSGIHLFVGVYGANTDGTVVIPTKYCDLGMIYPGANPTEADNYTDPTASMLAQMYALTNAAQFAASIAAGSALTEGVEFSIKDNKTLVASAERDGHVIENELGPVTAYAASLVERPDETYGEFCERMALEAVQAEAFADLSDKVDKLVTLACEKFQSRPIVARNIESTAQEPRISNEAIATDTAVILVPYVENSPDGENTANARLYIKEQGEGYVVIGRGNQSSTGRIIFTLIIFANAESWEEYDD